MSSNPTKLPLSELLELIIDHRGKTPNKMGFDDFSLSGVPVLSAKHVKTDGLVEVQSMRYASTEMYKKWMTVEVQEGDIILTSEAPMGEVFYIQDDKKYVLGQRVFGLRPNPRLINQKYLAAWLASSEGQRQIAARASGSTVQGIRQAELLKLEIDLPSREEQERIANVRFSLTDKISLNRGINQTLEAMAQAIFKSWFVDFDPVKAKIAAIEQGQDPLRAAMRAISGKTDAELDQMPREHHDQLAATAALFPDAMQESELGEIPKGWRVRQLPDVIDFLEGPGIRNWQYTEAEDGIKFINIRCIKDGDLKLDTANKITQEEAFGKYSHFQLSEDDIVISISGTLGRFGFVRKSHLPLSLNTSVVRFRAIQNVSTLHFIAGFVDTQLQSELEIRASGSAQRNFGPMHLKQIELLLPEYQVLKAHAEIVEHLFRKRQKNLEQIDNLTQLRDSLLPKLLSGELRMEATEM
ncbi:restriction endonuclease subunit S [Brachymonas chironomi]|uniref:restriction endonuclease subunit S n=1 Tax=Brachymonas chironomi TaxID=491919 RepID=UPI00039FF878|nr:restriction endonuclease subunit S [Brachymonas chironomi]